MDATALLAPLAALVLAPLFLGIINRTKAFFAGRHGQPLFQLYFDLQKLLGKGATYSRTSTWIVRGGPIIGLAALMVVVLLVPLGGLSGLVRFPGDLLLFAYLLSMARFFTVLAALDVGSSFEGMGASREVFFSTLTEPTLMLSLAVLAHQSHSLSLSSALGAVTVTSWLQHGTSLVLVFVALLVVCLAENARIPIDDPNTHLELTMIHEVMVLDHGGPDLAFILYGSALKLWIFASLVVGLVLPVRTGVAFLDLGSMLLGMGLLAIVLGCIESTMARLRLLRVPNLLVGATTLATLALVLAVR